MNWLGIGRDIMSKNHRGNSDNNNNYLSRHDGNVVDGNGDNGNDGDSSALWSPERLYQASLKDLRPGDVQERFYRHLMSSPACIESIERLLSESNSNSRDYSITIDSFDLLNSDPILGPMLLRFPTTLLPFLKDAVVMAQREILKQLQEEHGPNKASIANMYVKGENGSGGSSGVSMTRLHARLVHLPPYCFQSSLGQMEASDVG